MDSSLRKMQMVLKFGKKKKKILRFDHVLSWLGGGETSILIHWWWQCKTVPGRGGAWARGLEFVISSRNAYVLTSCLSNLTCSNVALQKWKKTSIQYYPSWYSLYYQDKPPKCPSVGVCLNKLELSTVK